MHPAHHTPGDLGPLPEPYRVYQYASAEDRMPLCGPKMDRPAVPVYTAEQMEAERRRCFALGAAGTPVERPVGRPVPERADFLLQIEECRREVAKWPAWMRQECTVPAWMANHATDL